MEEHRRDLLHVPLESKPVPRGHHLLKTRQTHLLKKIIRHHHLILLLSFAVPPPGSLRSHGQLQQVQLDEEEHGETVQQRGGQPTGQPSDAEEGANGANQDTEQNCQVLDSAQRLANDAPDQPTAGTAAGTAAGVDGHRLRQPQTGKIVAKTRRTDPLPARTPAHPGQQVPLNPLHHQAKLPPDSPVAAYPPVARADVLPAERAGHRHQPVHLCRVRRDDILLPARLQGQDSARTAEDQRSGMPELYLWPDKILLRDCQHWPVEPVLLEVQVQTVRQ